MFSEHYPAVFCCCCSHYYYCYYYSIPISSSIYTQSVCLFVCRLSYLCTLLKPLDGISRRLAGTIVLSQVTCLRPGPRSPHRKRRLGGQNCSIYFDPFFMVRCNKEDQISDQVNLIYHWSEIWTQFKSHCTSLNSVQLVVVQLNCDFKLW